jgi:hypothetical protein
MPRIGDQPAGLKAEYWEKRWRSRWPGRRRWRDVDREVATTTVNIENAMTTGELQRLTS